MYIIRSEGQIVARGDYSTNALKCNWDFWGVMDCWRDQKGFVDGRRGNLFLCFLDAGTASKKHFSGRCQKKFRKRAKSVSLCMFFGRAPRAQKHTFHEGTGRGSASRRRGFSLCVFGAVPAPKILFRKTPEEVLQTGEEGLSLYVFWAQSAPQKHTFWKMPEEVPQTDAKGFLFVFLARHPRAKDTIAFMPAKARW